MNKHEEKYFHIRKGIIFILSSMVLGFFFFWFGLYVFEQYRIEYSNMVFLVPYTISSGSAFIVYISLTKTK